MFFVCFNLYNLVEEPSIPILKMDEIVEERQINRLKTLRKERNATKVQNRLQQLRKAAGGDENLMPFILDCVHSYATLGETCDVLREVFGEYKEQAIY
ncbi:Methylmalonyl-CoA mutase [uncultured archaeon]|nr:Methylmalonyl-CoA mutase [uncultured archaeon]